MLIQLSFYQSPYKSGSVPREPFMSEYMEASIPMLSRDPGHMGELGTKGAESQVIAAVKEFAAQSDGTANKGNSSTSETDMFPEGFERKVHFEGFSTETGGASSISSEHRPIEGQEISCSSNQPGTI